MGAGEGQPHEERLRGVAMLDELDPLRSRPVRRVQVFGQVRGASHPAVPVDTVVAVAVSALLVLVKPLVVIADEAARAPATLIQNQVVKAIQSARRREMHLADSLSVVAGFGELTGQRCRILERV